MEKEILYVGFGKNHETFIIMENVIKCHDTPNKTFKFFTIEDNECDDYDVTFSNLNRAIEWAIANF